MVMACLCGSPGLHMYRHSKRNAASIRKCLVYDNNHYLHLHMRIQLSYRFDAQL